MTLSWVPTWAAVIWKAVPVAPGMGVHAVGAVQASHWTSVLVAFAQVPVVVVTTAPTTSCPVMAGAVTSVTVGLGVGVGGGVGARACG